MQWTTFISIFSAPPSYLLMITDVGPIKFQNDKSQQRPISPQILRYCVPNWPTTTTNSSDTRAFLEYSDRRLCCDGCPSNSVICDVQQRRQRQSSPFHNLRGLSLRRLTVTVPRSMILAAYRDGRHGRTTNWVSVQLHSLVLQINAHFANPFSAI